MKLKEGVVLFVKDERLLRESMGAWLDEKAGRLLIHCTRLSKRPS